MRRRHGLGLVELLVAVAILGILLAVLTAVFIGSTRSYRTIDTSASVQQRSEIATTLLGYELGLAGYRGVRTGFASNEFASHRLVITRGTNDTIRTRYYEDRFLQDDAAAFVFRDVTYFIGDHAGVPSLMRQEGPDAHPALTGVDALRVVAFIRADGTREPFEESLPISGSPPVALELQVVLRDGYTARFAVVFHNLDLASTAHVAVN